MYNLTHPLLRKILSQLREESITPYNTVPYDYRISQILVEGMLGVKPDLPGTLVQNWEQETGMKLKDNSKRFHRWWNEYGSGKPVRESTVIANYASTNLLPHHLEEEKASLIHGAKHYLPWDRNTHVSKDRLLIYYSIDIVDALLNAKISNLISVFISRRLL